MRYDTAPYDCRIVANTFLAIAAKDGKSLTNLHIQKYVYFAQGYYYADFKKPLVEEMFQAWKYGPVIPGLYEEFKHFKGSAISELYQAYDPVEKVVFVPLVNKDDRRFLKKIYNLFKDVSAIDLSKMSHEKDGPWDKVYVENNQSKEIPLEFMAEYFSKLIEQ